MRYLVIAATTAEVAHAPEGLEVVITGIGKTAAASVTTEALLARAREELVVLNVGTCGALRDDVTGLHLPSSVINHDINGEAIRALGYDPEEVLAISDGDGSVLASGDVFVTDPAVRSRLAERAHLVDMEGYGVAYACRRLGVPVRLVKHVSDSADEGARDWPSLVRASAAVLGEWLADITG